MPITTHFRIRCLGEVPAASSCFICSLRLSNISVSLSLKYQMQRKVRESRPRAGHLKLSTSFRELNSLQMQRLRFVGAHNRHHLDLQHVDLSGNCEPPPRYD